jgi:hypothetical protein
MLTEQVAVVQPDGSIRNVAITKPMSYGEKLAQNIRDSFSADKVVDGVLSFGGGMASSLAMSALQPDPEEVLQPGTPANALVGVGAGMASQGVQAPVIAADINPLAPYQSLTYGTGDANIMGGELFRQQILPIQVG